MCQPSNRSREMYEFPSSAPKSTLNIPYTVRPRPRTSSTARQHLSGQNVLKVDKTHTKAIEISHKRPFLSWSVVQTISTGCSSVGLRNVEAIALQRLWARLVLKRFFGMPKKNKRRTQSQERLETIWKAYKKQKRWNIWLYSRVSSFLGKIHPTSCLLSNSK